ncbi:tryptophan-rich sensory protein [Staphylococcus devriesei]|uniref:Tryptophan-rich sensory protein n=1 Tax=Staphylococcus devriesei TaxID=586733 RepID=A0A2T4KFH2_9STAP|nr:TspO/MBR family protein [Staphylococcus devriesei]PTE71174.1 tryptophan-rich sensory protein [Staphylococcus devriesei]RIL70428.1 tryptophan-rich sensory protein [Staphylococcus devriesei]
MKKYIIYCFHLLLPMIGGSIIGGLTANDTKNDYRQFKKPPFSPPGYIFPIVWPILYILMGVSFVLSIINSGKQRVVTVTHYLQLAFNYMWSLLYFKEKLRGVALVDSVVLLISVIINAITMFKAKGLAGLLQIPYILWSVYASYLNTGNWLLNKDNPEYFKKQ